MPKIMPHFELSFRGAVVTRIPAAVKLGKRGGLSRKKALSPERRIANRQGGGQGSLEGQNVITAPRLFTGWRLGNDWEPGFSSTGLPGSGRLKSNPG